MSSLKKLRDDLVAKGGYSITPQHRQLNDLKDLLNDMVTVRSGAPPAINDDQHVDQEHSLVELLLLDVYVMEDVHVIQKEDLNRKRFIQRG